MWHEGPLAGFDTETTSVDVEEARIVTAALLHREPGHEGCQHDREWLVNPGVDIPESATAIHGITTEHARNFGTPAVQAIEDIVFMVVGAVANGCALVVYNAPYDLTLLDRECRRYEVAPPELGDCLVIDPLVLDKYLDPYRRGKRTLEAVAAHYCVPFDGAAHDAAADALAAMRLAWKMARIFPAIRDLTAENLMALQVKAKAEQSASLQRYFRSRGNDEVVDPSWPIRMPA